MGRIRVGIRAAATVDLPDDNASRGFDSSRREQAASLRSELTVRADIFFLFPADLDADLGRTLARLSGVVTRQN